MNYGELPATGLYVVLSIVVVFAAILTMQIADVGKRNETNWKENARRLDPLARRERNQVCNRHIVKWGSG